MLQRAHFLVQAVQATKHSFEVVAVDVKQPTQMIGALPNGQGFVPFAIFTNPVENRRQTLAVCASSLATTILDTRDAVLLAMRARTPE